MKICAYVQTSYAKATYSNENFNVRQWVGLSVIIDSLKRQGHEVEYAGKTTVHQYDLVLLSLTSDCDWWNYIAERVTWQKGGYKVIVGGAGLLNIRPFLEFCDIFVWGRGENLIGEIVRAEENGNRFINESVAYADTFNADTDIYYIKQDKCYPHNVVLSNGKTFIERTQGCPHKCLFCGYSWQRKYQGEGEFEAGSGLWAGEDVNKERAIIDMYKAQEYDLKHLRITAIDGMSQRLRFMVNKKITRDMLQELYRQMARHDKPHQLKIYNIVGYPSETAEDWEEFVEDIRIVDSQIRPQKQWSIVLHNTPFRPMPATPAACWPASYDNYRGKIAKVLGRGNYKGNIFYQGNAFWAVESMGTDSLSTVILSMICHRGTESDSDNVRKISCSSKFWGASSIIKLRTLEKYFDVAKLFKALNYEELPTRYIRSYAKLEKFWENSKLS